MKDRALSTIGLWVVVGLVIWVGGFFSVAEQASFGLLALSHTAFAAGTYFDN